MAEARAPYGRRRVDVLGTVPDAETPPTYYDRPALKPSDWRWLIITYLFVGGLAGAAQVIASVVDFFGTRRDRPLVSAGRYIAIGGSLLSATLLIADLKTPSRWYNMLRIYRGTSPMSIGAWGLAAFGASSGLAATAQFVGDVFGARWARRAARLTGVPAGLSGALVATYTGSLLAATSTPLWAAGYRWLPAVFGLSGTSTATALLRLILERTDPHGTAGKRLDRLALLISGAELVLSLRLDEVWKRERVSTPLDRPPLSVPYRTGALGLGVLLPLFVHLAQVVTGQPLKSASRFAAVAALAGGFTQRAVIIFAGKQSAEDAVDYFRYASR